MKTSDPYLKVVTWSDEDACYIGRCPDLFGGGCHGDDEAAVYAELCEIVEDVLEDYVFEGKSLPPVKTKIAQIIDPVAA